MSQASWLTRGYRAALWLCPPAFRRRFGDELRQDFADGLAEAQGASGGIARFALAAGADLLRTLLVQWLRTGAVLPAIVSGAGAALLLVVVARLRAATSWTRAIAPQDEELVLLLLLAGVVLFVVIATIFLTQYLLWPRVRRRRA